MSKFICRMVLVLLLFVQQVCIGTTRSGVESTNGDTVVSLETSIMVGKSVFFHMPALNYSQPVNVTLALRVVDLIEPSATILVGRSIDKHGDRLNDRVFSAVFELNISPSFWRWYRPSIGLGWFYSEINPYLSKDRNQGLSCSLSLLGFSIDRMTLMLRRIGIALHVKPIMSAGTVRYGPIIPWGSRWIENNGNYYLEIELFSIGAGWW